MSQKIALKQYKIFNKSSFGLEELSDNSIDCLSTDPPYGISFQNNYWDKDLPDKKIWSDCLRAMKPGAFGCVFSSVRLMHRLMVDLEDSGFRIKDVLFWVSFNGMPKSRDVSLEIDKELGHESHEVGTYNYVQGYKKEKNVRYYAENNKKILKATSDIGITYKGAGLGLKPAYEPIILVQKPTEKGLTIAQNIIKYGTGALNLENTRIPYENGESKVGHNPHPLGRVPSNIIRTERFEDGYDKFFVVQKVRQHADEYNIHPTLKPVNLMVHLLKLTSFDNQVVLDPFMGSGSTGLACLDINRQFVGYELDREYFEIALKRIENSTSQMELF